MDTTKTPSLHTQQLAMVELSSPMQSLCARLLVYDRALVVVVEFVHASAGTFSNTCSMGKF